MAFNANVDESFCSFVSEVTDNKFSRISTGGGLTPPRVVQHFQKSAKRDELRFEETKISTGSGALPPRVVQHFQKSAKKDELRSEISRISTGGGVIPPRIVQHFQRKSLNG